MSWSLAELEEAFSLLLLLFFLLKSFARCSRRREENERATTQRAAGLVLDNSLWLAGALWNINSRGVLRRGARVTNSE